MVVAAGFTLLKLLNSFFAGLIDREYGRALFNKTIWAIRAISVRVNDLPSRLAEVLAQLWKGGGAGTKGTGLGNGDVDGTLQLKVRCRMSMSLVFDSVWRWREEFQASGRGNLECKASIHRHHLTALRFMSARRWLTCTQRHSRIPRIPTLLQRALPARPSIQV